MKLKHYNRGSVNGRMLHLQIKESNCIDGFAGMQFKNGVVSVYGKKILNEPQLDSLIQEHNHLISDLPRLLKYQIDKNQDFRRVNHNTDLTVSLDVEEMFGEDQSNRGLLIKKVYRLNEEDLFFIDYLYQFGIIGQVTHQKLTLKWYNEDGQINQIIKDKGFKKLSKKQERDVVFKRRSSIIFLLEVEIIKLLSAGTTNDEEAGQMIDLGATLMEEISIEIGKFKNSGHGQPIVDKLTQLQSTYTFLGGELAPGVTVIGYISNFLNY